MIISKKKRLGLGLAATALAASTMVGSANADPAQYNAFVGVGSDTTQDVHRLERRSPCPQPCDRRDRLRPRHHLRRGERLGSDPVRPLVGRPGRR